jgi:hypothetical protein
VKSKYASKEKSEEEIYGLLEEAFGRNNIEKDPKIDSNKADFLVKGRGVYVEVFSIKDITSDLREETPYSKNVTLIDLKQKAEDKILDRIASKILHECEQLPKEKPNVVAKTEGIFVSPDDVIDALIGKPFLLIDKTTMNTEKKHEPPLFRTEDELMNALNRISVVIAYDNICPHGKLCGVLGNNQNNAEIPLDEKIRSVFQAMLCEKCQSST